MDDHRQLYTVSALSQSRCVKLSHDLLYLEPYIIHMVFLLRGIVDVKMSKYLRIFLTNCEINFGNGALSKGNKIMLVTYVIQNFK